MSNAITQVDTKALGLSDDVLSDLQAGTDFKAEELTTPRLMLVQALSQARKKNSDKYIPGVNEGDIVEVSSGQIFKQPLEIAILSHQLNWLEWSQEDALVANHGSDASCLKGCTQVPNKVNTYENADGNMISQSGTYVIAIIQDDEIVPCEMHFSKSSLSIFSRINTQLSALRIEVNGNKVNPPIMFSKFKLTSVERTRGKDSWFAYNFEKAGNTLEGGLFSKLKAKADEFKNPVVAELAAPSEETGF